MTAGSTQADRAASDQARARITRARAARAVAEAATDAEDARLLFAALGFTKGDLGRAQRLTKRGK